MICLLVCLSDWFGPRQLHFWSFLGEVAETIQVL